VCLPLVHYLAYVAHFVFLGDVWIRTQKAAVAVCALPTLELIILNFSLVKYFINPFLYSYQMLRSVLRNSRICRIRMFKGLLDPDPLVRGMDPDPSIIKKKKSEKPTVTS
jgi:hypothetical protein